MAANMYDQAAQAQFINTYVPINFGELYRIGAAQKAAVDEAAQQFGTQLQKFGEFQSRLRQIHRDTMILLQVEKISRML